MVIFSCTGAGSAVQPCLSEKVIPRYTFRPKTMNERHKLAGFTAVSMLILASVMTGLSASLLSIASDFGVVPSRAGIFYSLHFGGFIGLILLSLLVHGLRGRVLLVSGTAALYAVALLGAAYSTTIGLLGIALVAAGGAGGIIESHTATLQVMTSRDEREAGSLLAFTQSFFALGALLTPVYLSLEERLQANWRSLFVALSAIAVVALLIAATMRSRRFVYVHGEAKSFLWRPLLRVSVAMALYVGAEVTLFGWAPTVLELYHDIPASRARLAPTLFWIGMLGGRLAVTRLTAKFSPGLLLRISTLLGVAGSVMVVIVSTEPLLWLAVAISAIACAGIWPLIVATSGDAGHETATTIVVAAGGLGAAVFPYLAGRISEILPGHLILSLAAPLLLGVFFLSLSASRGGVRRA